MIQVPYDLTPEGDVDNFIDIDMMYLFREIIHTINKQEETIKTLQEDLHDTKASIERTASNIRSEMRQLSNGYEVCE